MGYVDTAPRGYVKPRGKMSDYEIGKKLFTIGKKNPCLRWQDNKLIREAGARLMNTGAGREIGGETGGRTEAMEGKTTGGTEDGQDETGRSETGEAV